MAEKRFGMYQNTLYDDGDILNPFNAMKLLNHFDKENTKLKEENKQLKSALKELKEIGDYQYSRINELSDENKQLKQFIKELTTKGTDRIDLSNGYSYNVNAVLTDYRGDVE